METACFVSMCGLEWEVEQWFFGGVGWQMMWGACVSVLFCRGEDRGQRWIGHLS